MWKKKQTLKQQQKEQQENKKKTERLMRDVAVLRSLLVYPLVGVPDFGGIAIDSIRRELIRLYGIYGGELKFLIISIIDIIHDAHGSRVGATTRVAHFQLFKLVVCNIFGINESLYDYIYTRVVPVTQNVLQKFIEGSDPAATSLTAQEYFTQISIAQGYRPQQPRRPLKVTTTILRDNVGIGRELRKYIESLGFDTNWDKTPSIVVDSVSTPMVLADYGELDNYIAANQGPRHVTNELFPGTVNITVSGSLQANYSANIAYTHPAAAVPVFNLTFPWNPTIGHLVGYNPINCNPLPCSIQQNPNQVTCLPPNNTKNCAFIIANTYALNMVAGETLAQYIARANDLLQAELATLARGIVGFQPLTLEQYTLCKLIGDYSYVLYYIQGRSILNFVTTSDIISGLRLFLKGIAVLFSMGLQMVVFYNGMNFDARIVIPKLPHVINTTARKQKEVKEKAEKKILNTVKGKINSPSKTTNLKPKIPVKAQILRNQKSKRGAPTLRPQIRTNYGVQKGGQTHSLFDETLTQAVENPWFSKELSPLIKPDINTPISSENLKLLIQVLKNQFKIFKDQLDKFEQGNFFFMSSNITAVNYRNSCTTIIEYLNAIFDIMSLPECIEDFTESCKGKSYEECIKSMSSYVIMFPFIFDEKTMSWYLNYTYPFRVCLNEYILSLLDLPDIKSKYQNIINFVSSLKTISKSKSDSTPLDYAKHMPFNNAVTFVLMSECIRNRTQQEFSKQVELYNEQSKIQLTEFNDERLPDFLSSFDVKLTDYEDTSAEGDDADEAEADDADNADYEDIGGDEDYIKSLNSFFEDFVVDNNILYEDFAKKMVSFLIPEENIIIREGVFSVIKFILLFQSFDNISLCSYTLIKTIIEALLTHKYSSKSFASINNEFNMLFYYNNLDNFFQDIPEVVTKIKETRDEQQLTSIEDLSILEQNISVQIDLYSYCVDYALSNFYDELYDDNIDSELTFETTDDYVNFQMGKLQKCIDTQVEKYLSYDEVTEETQPFDPLGLRQVTETNQLKHRDEISGTNGGKNNRISNPNPKHNAKYRKKYKKFVSKYIIKKKKNNKKNNNNKKNKKNKTRKNKRLTKSTPNSKRNNKTLKNKKRKTKPNKHKSKQNNKKTKTNYYNSYKHNKTLKH